jgi:hypothetical protein
MKKVDLRGEHDLSEIIGYAYRIYARNFVPLFLIALITLPLQLLTGVIAGSSTSDGAQAAVTLLQIPGLIVAIIANMAIIFAAHEITGGAPPDFARSIDAVFERGRDIGRTVARAFVLTFLAVFAAPALAIYWLLNREATIDGRRDWWLAAVPLALAVYTGIRWQFFQQAVIIDGKAGWEALDESAGLVRGHWWRIFGILLVVLLIQLGPVLLGQAASVLPPLAAAAIGGAVLALVLPFAAVSQTLLYYDLTARKAAHDSVDRLPAPE